MYPGVDAAPIAPSALHGGITVFDTIYKSRVHKTADNGEAGGL